MYNNLFCAMPSDHSSPYLPWIQTKKNRSYFFTESGESWTPIGQNDAITWPELNGLFLAKNVGTASEYFSMLAKNGVTCMRLMLEYCQVEHRYLENPVGRFQPNMVALWDDLFGLAATHGIRFILTPFDTFWMSRRWIHHPYNKRNGGPCPTKSRWLVSKEMRQAIKNRLAFVTERWGSSGVIFAWDLWNEIHPAHARNEVEQLSHYIDDVGGFLRKLEEQLHGRSHLQTVSFYGTLLLEDHRIAATAFHHPALDFATIHFYDEPAIDRPKNTFDVAMVTGMLTRECIAEIEDNRPFFDTEHGPIYSFNNRRKTLDEQFDDEYFANMQWAHFASGGAGGGMRWPYRNPHVLTKGMRNAQRSLSLFAGLINWHSFVRRDLNSKITIDDDNTMHFSCGDEQQAIIWLLRKRATNAETSLSLCFSGDGKYSITYWNSTDGAMIQTDNAQLGTENQKIATPSFEKNLAIYVRKIF
jgi:hypothetical protein